MNNETPIQRNMTVRERCDEGLPVSYEEVLEEARQEVYIELSTSPPGSGAWPDWFEEIVVEERNEIIDGMCDAMAAVMGYER